MNYKILRLPKVKELTGLSCSSVYNRIANGVFPSPIKLGGQRAVGWIESEIETWLANQIKKRHSQIKYEGGV